VAIVAASDKANGVGLPEFTACPDTTPAKNTIAVPERIADFLHPATHGDVLNGAGVGGLRNEQLSNVTPQFLDFFRIAPNHHIFLHV
jgi:hypothetical protein